MGIQPQDAQVLALRATVPRHRTHRSDAEAMVSAQKNGKVTQPQLRVHRLVHLPIPEKNLIEMPVSVDRGKPRIWRTAEIAPVCDLETTTLERGLDARDAQRLGPHG